MKRQRGVALITALLIVALATTTAVAMVSRQQYDIRRTGNLLQAEQGWLYVQGIEGWAGEILRRDREDDEVDHLGEEWATILPPIPIDGGVLSGELQDRQGRFNLNNLLRRDGQIDEQALAQFQRLLRALSLEPDLAQALADWLDGDIEPRFPGGAEDDIYLGLERPYRSANGPLYSITELRLLNGMDGESYAALLPHVSALPARTRLNVNTASAEVLMSLHEELSQMDAEQLIDERGEGGYESVDAFLQHPALAGREIPAQRIGVGSDYFVVRSQVQFGRVLLEYQSLLHRDNKGQTQLVQRAQGIL